MAKKSTQHRTRARHSPEYRLLLERLIAVRKTAGVTQAHIARKLGKPQSHVSKCESLDREINIVDLLRWCQALNLNFGEFMSDFEREVQELDAKTHSPSPKRPRI